MTLLDLNPILVSDGIFSAVMDFIKPFLCLKLKLQLKYLMGITSQIVYRWINALFAPSDIFFDV